MAQRNWSEGRSSTWFCLGDQIIPSDMWGDFFWTWHSKRNISWGCPWQCFAVAMLEEDPRKFWQGGIEIIADELRAHGCYLFRNITYHRILFSLFAALYKLSCILFGRILLLCKHFTNRDMKHLVLPTAPKSWCLTAYSDSCFSLHFHSLPIRQHSMAYSWLIGLLSALMSFWLKGSYEQTVRWADMDK